MTSRHDRPIAAAVAVALLLLPSGALAQAIDIPAALTLDIPEQTWVVGAYTHQFRTDLDLSLIHI